MTVRVPRFGFGTIVLPRSSRHSGITRACKILRRYVVAQNGTREHGLDDTFDDMPGIDYSLFGSDGPPVVSTSKVLRQTRSVAFGSSC